MEPIVATSLIAAIDDGGHFESGRALSAWIGLVPRQYAYHEAADILEVPLGTVTSRLARGREALMYYLGEAA